MDIKLSDSLIREYPRVLENIAYISVGKGWYFLLDQLCHSLERNMTENWRMYPTVKILQIKEKFGLLRIYTELKPLSFEEFEKNKQMEEDTRSDYATYTTLIRYYSGYMEGQVHLVEGMSMSFCENCGTVKNVKLKSGKSGWLKCYCPKCRRNADKIKEKLWDEADKILKRVGNRPKRKIHV